MAIAWSESALEPTSQARQVEEVHAVLDEDATGAIRVPEPMSVRQLRRRPRRSRTRIGEPAEDRPATGFDPEQSFEGDDERGESQHVIDGDDSVVGKCRGPRRSGSRRRRSPVVSRRGRGTQRRAPGRRDRRESTAAWRLRRHRRDDRSTGCRHRTSGGLRECVRRVAWPAQGPCSTTATSCASGTSSVPRRRTSRTIRIPRGRGGGRRRPGVTSAVRSSSATPMRASAMP